MLTPTTVQETTLMETADLSPALFLSASLDLSSFSALQAITITSTDTLLRSCKAMVMIWSVSVFILVLLAVSTLALVANGENKMIKVKKVKGKKVDQFEQLFAKRNTPIAHDVGFWDYQTFITAAALYEPLGFGTTGGKLMGQKEMAAFLGHVASKTSCAYGVATGGPLAWGLCYNREMSPMQSYCDESWKYKYPCSPGAEYYGRGALRIYCAAGEALKADLLNHPEYIEQNATLAFQAAI
ncbi:hypothetical protein Bca101_025806 [Brassica carinata]